MPAVTQRSFLLQATGRALRARRIQHGLSQEALAHLAELDRTYISSLERGLRNPTVLTLWKLAKVLRCRPSELLAAAEREATPERA